MEREKRERERTCRTCVHESSRRTFTELFRFVRQSDLYHPRELSGRGLNPDGMWRNQLKRHQNSNVSNTNIITIIIIKYPRISSDIITIITLDPHISTDRITMINLDPRISTDIHVITMITLDPRSTDIIAIITKYLLSNNNNKETKMIKMKEAIKYLWTLGVWIFWLELDCMFAQSSLSFQLYQIRPRHI